MFSGEPLSAVCVESFHSSGTAFLESSSDVDLARNVAPGEDLLEGLLGGQW